MKRVGSRAVADSSVVLAPQVQEQLDRILNSEGFRNALTLQRLLRYITGKAAEDPPGEIKEYTIGVESFGRGPDYDPKVDTVVRVEMHRLRQKLEEYYKSEGAGDPILVEIPKGHYLPSFAAKTPPAPTLNGIVGAAEPPSPPPQRSESESEKPVPEKRGRVVQLTQFLSHPVAIASAAIVVFFLGSIVGARWVGWNNASKGAASAVRTGPSAMKTADPVQDFWASFLGDDTTPLLGYPDAVFLIDETNDLFRFRRGASDDRGAPVNYNLAQQFASNPSLVAKAAPLFYEDGYTGVGEAESISRLTRLFTQMGLQLVVERSDGMTVKDFSEHNIILLGSSFQNKAVAQIPIAGDFVFDNPEPRRELWRGRILNLHPHPGESAVYRTERDPATQVLKTDYALMSIQPGNKPGRFIAVFGGLDTTGTAGASEFATSRPGIEALTKFLASLGEGIIKGQPPLFQAVLRVDLANGRDVRRVNLVTVHLLR